MGATGNHQKIVAAVKADLVRRGVDLSGPDGGFQITKRVAWALRGEGAGLLDKPSGNNSGGYAVDIVAYPDGQIYDILGDGGGANTPQWPGDGEQNDPSRYRPAFDPGDAPIVVRSRENPNPPVDAGLLARVAALEAQLTQQSVLMREQTASIAALTVEQNARLATLAARVQVLEERPAPELDPSNLVVVGSTSRVLTHAHQIDLAVRRR